MESRDDRAAAARAPTPVAPRQQGPSSASGAECDKFTLIPTRLAALFAVDVDPPALENQDVGHNRDPPRGNASSSKRRRRASSR